MENFEKQSLQGQNIEQRNKDDNKEKDNEENSISRRGFLKKAVRAGIGAIVTGASLGEFSKQAFGRKGTRDDEIEKKVRDNNEEIKKEGIEEYLKDEQVKNIKRKELKEKNGSIEDICQIDISEKTKFNAKDLEEYCEKYYNHGEGRQEIKDSFRRMNQEVDIEEHKEIFREEGVEEDLIFLSVIETKWKNEHNKKENRYGARGYHQFLKKTGMAYGLKINDKIDERSDPVKSARACARYLKDMYKTFNDWDLALARYNGGFAKKYRLETENKDNMSFNGFLDFMAKRFDEKVKSRIENGELLFHKVEGGQGLLQICEIYKVSETEILEINPKITNPNRIKKGQKINLPNKKVIKNMICQKLFFEYGYEQNVTYPFRVRSAGKAMNKEIQLASL